MKCGRAAFLALRGAGEAASVDGAPLGHEPAEMQALLDGSMKKLTFHSAAKPVPEAMFLTEEGGEATLADYQGQYLLVNFWATWCPPCVAVMPGINNLYQEVKDDNVEFIMLSVDQDFEKARKFRKKKGFEFEIYQLAGPIPQMYNSNSIPTTYVIDADGNLALTHLGMGDFDTKDFKQFLKELK